MSTKKPPPSCCGVTTVCLFGLMLTISSGLGCSKDDPDSRLLIAAADGDMPIVKTLVEQGAKVNATGPYGTSLHRAAYNGHLEVARFLLDHGANVDSEIKPDLMRVMEKGYLSALPINQSIDIKEAFGTTPLHHALFRGHQEMVELLVSKGADPKRTFTVGPDWKAKYIRSATDAAKLGGHEDLLKLLEKQNPK